MKRSDNQGAGTLGGLFLSQRGDTGSNCAIGRQHQSNCDLVLSANRTLLESAAARFGRRSIAFCTSTGRLQ